VLQIGRPIRPTAASARPLISVAPHNIRLYEYFLRFHLAQGRSFITSDALYGRPPNDGRQGRIVVRHDVDYTPENLALLVDVERRLDVRSDIHLIVNDAFYDIRPYVMELRKLSSEGFCLGLHTLAPSEDDFYSVLRVEILRFTDLFGFAPKTFSVHGVCPSPKDWHARRQRFLAKIGARLESFGFVGSHNLSGPDFWVEDSGVGGEFAYLHADWVRAAPAAGQVMGVLVHPDHWTSWPIRWSVNWEEVIETPLLADFVRTARAYAPAGDTRSGA
jgi:hypothetical protein